MSDLLINREQALARERELEAEIEKRDKMLSTLFGDVCRIAAKIADFQQPMIGCVATAVPGAAKTVKVINADELLRSQQWQVSAVKGGEV